MAPCSVKADGRDLMLGTNTPDFGRLVSLLGSDDVWEWCGPTGERLLDFFEKNGFRREMKKEQAWKVTTDFQVEEDDINMFADEMERKVRDLIGLNPPRARVWKPGIS